MLKLEFTEEVKIADKAITAIQVEPLTFMKLVGVYDKLINPSNKAVQRQRILTQAHFMAGTERVVPTHEETNKIHFKVMKQIIDNLDNDQGVSGKVIDEKTAGISSPLVYKLGTPIEVNDGRKIIELEFQASTYGEVEDILAAENDLAKTRMMLETLAVPLGEEITLQRLPGFAVDMITVADGVTIMRKVAPAF